ncbi:MAG: hypothetical protein ACD_11C00115G0017 [uncultured bacterium]|nr:MAG: hypothetical protein ACD_11C00115G0017 [uncultured bacterium]HBR72104.1 hypothetical protein [Candidatus Moranbacteria bacterium]
MNTQTIIGLEDYSISELELCICNHIATLKENFIFEGLDFSIIKIVFFGSRIFGKPKKNSDLDIKIEYIGKAREDDLFNALNDKKYRLYIEDIAVDFYPKRL